MNRRGFISLLAGAAGMAALPLGRRDPHRVIFVPPRLAMSQPSKQLFDLLSDITRQVESVTDISQYLTSQHVWYLRVEDPLQFRRFLRTGCIRADFILNDTFTPAAAGSGDGVALCSPAIDEVKHARIIKQTADAIRSGKLR